MLEKLLLQRMQLSPCAMPSMVSMRRPSASAPSTRHEQTRRPSTMTLQAPQSPVPQPSLAPVSPRRSRSTSSSVSSGWQRNSTSSPLIVVETATPAITCLPLGHSAILAARLASTPATFLLNSIVPRLSSMGRQAAEQAAASAFQRRLVQPRSDESLSGILDQEHRRRDRAQRHARRRDAAFVVERQVDARR